MSTPIPAKYAAGLANNYPILYVVRLNPRGGNPMFFVNTPSSTEIVSSFEFGRVVRYNTVPLAEVDLLRGYLAAEVNKSQVEGIGEIDFNIQISDGGGLAGRNECTIRFLNQGLFSNTLLQYDLDNTDVEVWQGYLSPSSFDIDGDLLLLFKGNVYEWSDYDHNLLTLRCLDTRDSIDSPLPPRNITESTFPSAPDASKNEPIPMLVGDFSTVNNATYGSYTRYAHEVGGTDLLEVAPSILTHAQNYNLYVSDRGTTTVGDDRFYHITEDRDWVGVIATSYTSWAADAQGVYYAILAPDAYATAYVKPKVKGATYNLTDASAYQNLFDSDYTNTVNVPATKQFAVTFSDFEEPGVLIKGSTPAYGYGANIDMKINVVLTAVTGTVRLYWKNKKTGQLSSALTHTGASQNMAAGLNTYNFDLITEDWDGVKNVEIAIVPFTSSECDIESIWVEARYFPPVNSVKKVTVETQRGNILGQYYQRIKRSETRLITRSDANIYFSVKGFSYGSWISTARSNGYTTSNIIEQPAYLVEYILREYLGEVSNNIDMDSFDVVGNTTDGKRDGWLCGASIGAQRSAMEWIRQICSEFGMILYQDPNDASGYLRWRLVALPTTSDSVYLDLSELSIHADYQTGHPSLFRCYWTRQSDIKNDIYLNYKKNYTLGKFDKAVYVSDIAGDGTMATNLTTGTGALRDTTYVAWMEESQSAYDLVRPAVYNLEFIRDTTTAENLLKLLCDYYAFKRFKIDVNLLKTSETMTLRLGDVVRLDSALLGSNHSATSKFMVTRVNYPGMSFSSESFLTVTLEEIPSVLTGART